MSALAATSSLVRCGVSSKEFSGRAGHRVAGGAPPRALADARGARPAPSTVRFLSLLRAVSGPLVTLKQAAAGNC